MTAPVYVHRSHWVETQLLMCVSMCWISTLYLVQAILYHGIGTKRSLCEGMFITGKVDQQIRLLPLQGNTYLKRFLIFAFIIFSTYCSMPVCH